MKKLARKIAMMMLVFGAMLAPVLPVAMTAETVYADDACGDGQVDTNLFGCVDTDDRGSGIQTILSLIVSVLLYGLGAMAVIGVVVAGIMYLTARDNEAQVAKAKTRLIEVVIGLIAWAALFSILNWLIPGFESSDLPYDN